MPSESQQLIIDSVGKLLSDHVTPALIESVEGGDFAADLWSELVNQGLLLLGLDEASGGYGGTFGDQLALLRECGRHAVPAPVSQTLLANHLRSMLGRQGLMIPSTVIDGAVLSGSSESISGELRDVPWGAMLSSVLVRAELEGASCWIELSVSKSSDQGTNIAGEPTATLSFDGAAPMAVLGSVSEQHLRELLHRGAAMHSAMMAGALEQALQIAVGYVLERKQFGQPLAKFQAIQHQLAVMATEVAASTRSVDQMQMTEDAPSDLDVAIAKARVGEAVGASTDTAHQVMGAMGYTREHHLNYLTRRLWLWRDQFGHESFWQSEIGKHFLSANQADLWTQITDLS